MNKFRITGKITSNVAETESGYETVDIDETIETEVGCAAAALTQFLDENQQYEYFGTLKTCDAYTYGQIGAHFYDQNENQAIDVERVGEKK